jgi:DNA-binding response OmpR family regulator
MNKPLALIIEDDFDLSEIFSAALQRDEFETEVVRDGAIAMKRLAGIPPAIIVLDLHLPHVDGATILNQIRATESFSKTAVIVTTADAQQADTLQGIADLVLLKPVSVDQLHELAKRLLIRWRQNL